MALSKIIGFIWRAILPHEILGLLSPRFIHTRSELWGPQFVLCALQLRTKAALLKLSQ